MDILNRTMKSKQENVKVGFSEKQPKNSCSKYKTTLAVFLFLCILFANRSSFGQTYSAYQAGDPSYSPTGSWRGYVYDNRSFSTTICKGYMGYYDVSANFSTDWGIYGPGPFGSTILTENDNYSVRYRMSKTFENGLYSIAVFADDAAAVSSNGGTSWNVLNDWDCNSVVNTTVTGVPLSGLTNMVFEYAECSANAKASITFTQTCQVPGSPQSLAGVGTGLTSATLSWSTGVPAGTSTYYYYSLYKATDNSLVTSGNQQEMTKTLTGLLANTAYYFKVYSQAGCYAVSSATATSSTFYTGIIPGTPTSLTTTAIGTTTATLNWAAGSPAGNPTPTYYWVLKNSGGTTITSSNTTSTSASVTGLTTNTTYYFTVYGSNNVGNSATATSSNFFTLPVNPTGVTATPSTIPVGSSSNLNATSAGVTIDWYTAATGGTTLGSIASGADFTVTPATTTTYYAEAVGPATNTAELSLAPGQNGSLKGAMFDVTAVSADRAVTGFKYANSAGIISVYYKIGSYSGYQTTPSAWIDLGDFTSDGLTPWNTIDIPDITIPSGLTYAFYLYNTSGNLYMMNSAQGNSSARLSVNSGYSTNSLFGNTSYDKTLCGYVLYGDQGPASASRTSVGVTVTQAPATQASGVTFSTVYPYQMGVSWAIGNGSKRAVFIKAASSGTAAPVNGTAYTANTTFGSGTQLGSSGWYCVYNGTGTSVTVTGLLENTAYQVHVCEYNGTTGNEAYNTTSATNNPKSQTTPISAISSFSPTSTGTGVSVLIQGGYIGLATAVSFGGTAASSFTMNNLNSITAVVAAGTTGSVSVTTPGGTVTLAGFTYVTTPGTQASNVAFASTTNSQTAVNWTNGNGSSRAVFILAGTTGNAAPVNGTTYTASTTFGSGTQAGTGWYCIYSGTGTSVTVTGLSANSSYRVMVTEYNGSAGGQMYKTSTATSNPNNVTTVGVPTIGGFTPTSTGTGVSVVITGTYLAGATAVSFGGTAASSFAVNTATQVTAAVAAGSTGSVSVTTPGGTATLAGFNYVTTPATQTSNVAFASTGTSITNVTWTNGTGSSRAVFILAGSTGSALPVNGTTYVASPSYTFGYPIGSSGWYCIYNGTGTSVTVNNLSPATTYRVMVTEYNGSAGGEMYNTSTATLNPNNVTTPGAPTISSFTPTSGGTGMSVVITGTYLTGATAVSFGGTAASSFTVNSATQITAVVAAGSTGSVSVTTPLGIATSSEFTYVATPSTQATNIVFSSVQLTQMTIGWTNGNGTNKAVFMKVASSGSALPVNGTAYTASTVYGSGNQAGSGWYCIYNNTGNSVTVTGLSASTAYQVHVCEYNGNTGGQMYNTTSSTNNPKSQATATPTISTSGTLTAFSSCAGTASAYQNFSASGSNLTANITVTAPTGFEVCLTSGGTYTSTVTLTQSSGSVTSTPVYVRMTAAATGSPSGNVALSSSGATTVNVSASGTMSQSPATAAAGNDQINCNSGTFTLAGNNPSVGTGAWSVVTGTATITTLSAYNSGVTGIPAGTSATLRWIISNSPCTASTDDVILTNKAAPATAAAGDDQSNCNSGTFTLAGNNPSVGTGAWSVVSGTATITTLSANNSGVTAVPAGSSATLRWTISNSPCTPSTDDIVLTNNELPVVASITGTSDLTVGTTTTLNCTTAGGSWSSSATAVATVNAGVVTGVTAGTATISYTVTDGNGCSKSSTLDVTVGKGNQSISFTLASTQNYGASPITLNGTATSGLTVSYTSSNTNVASISGNTLSIVGIGSATITASQAGNVNYNAAPVVTEGLTVNAVGLTWTGNANTTDWNTAGNWSPATVPTAGYDVSISTGTTNKPHVTSNVSSPASCNSLTLASGSLLTIDAGKALTVSGTFTNSGTAAALLIESGGSLITTGSVSGNINIQRDVEGNTDLSLNKYHLVSVPLAPSNSSTAALFTGSYLYQYLPATNVWNGMGSTLTTALDETVGYMIYYPNASTTYTFTGVPNTGAFTPSVTYPGHEDGLNFALVPNPYPSNIDWNATTGWTKTNIGTSIWFYNNGNYDVWNGTSGTNGASRYIGVGQAFFVQTTAAGAALAMDNDVRTHSAATFLKSGNPIANQLRVRADANTMADELLVGFAETTANTYKASEDALKLQGAATAPQLYTIADNIRLSINNLTALTSNASVPMNFETGFQGDVTLSFSQLESFPANLAIRLEDNHTHQFTNLRTQSTYTFAHQPDNASDRFVLHFGSATGIDDNLVSNGNIWISVKTVNIRSHASAGEKALVEIFNAAGQRVFSKQITLSELTRVPVSLSGFAVVRVSTGMNVWVAKGIF